MGDNEQMTAKGLLAAMVAWHVGQLASKGTGNRFALEARGEMLIQACMTAHDIDDRDLAQEIIGEMIEVVIDGMV